MQGPGLVYIDMQAGDRFFKEVQMSLFLLLLYICLYIIMAFIVWFDKKEGKNRVKMDGSGDGMDSADDMANAMNSFYFNMFGL